MLKFSLPHSNFDFLINHIAPGILLSDWVHWNFEWWKWAPILTLLAMPWLRWWYEVWDENWRCSGTSHSYWKSTQLSSVQPSSAELAATTCVPAARRRRRHRCRRCAPHWLLAVRLHLFSSKPAAFHHHLEQKKVLTPLGNMSWLLP